MNVDLIIRGIAILCIYSSSLFCLWRFINAFHDGTLLYDLKTESRINFFLFALMVISSFFGWTMFLQAGFERALFFLPWSAGEWNVVDGTFESYRWSGSWILALYGSLSLHSLARTIIWRNHQRHIHIQSLLRNGQRELADNWLK